MCSERIRVIVVIVVHPCQVFFVLTGEKTLVTYSGEQLLHRALPLRGRIPPVLVTVEL